MSFKKQRSPLQFLLIIVLVALLIPNVINIFRGPAAKPTMFDDQYSLSQAKLLSHETGKPMLVLVTADWCPPCQTLKRSTLTDPEVVAWVNENTIPVYLEDGENKDEIKSLPVRSFPTTFVIQDGEIVVSMGYGGADEYLGVLKSKVIPIQ
jgi:thiol-disulfide isomerase/thioredoxin